MEDQYRSRQRYFGLRNQPMGHLLPLFARASAQHGPPHSIRPLPVRGRSVNFP